MKCSKRGIYDTLIGLCEEEEKLEKINNCSLIFRSDFFVLLDDLACNKIIIIVDFMPKKKKRLARFIGTLVNHCYSVNKKRVKT